MNRQRRLSSLDLKILAAVTMLIDHLGITLFPQAVWMRCVGRLAFPLFAFLIAEGFCRTRSFQRYLLRLLLCAAISEVPFNLLRSGRWSRRGRCPAVPRGTPCARRRFSRGGCSACICGRTTAAGVW